MADEVEELAGALKTKPQVINPDNLHEVFPSMMKEFMKKKGVAGEDLKGKEEEMRSIIENMPNSDAKKAFADFLNEGLFRFWDSLEKGFVLEPMAFLERRPVDEKRCCQHAAFL